MTSARRAGAVLFAVGVVALSLAVAARLREPTPAAERAPDATTTTTSTSTSTSTTTTTTTVATATTSGSTGPTPSLPVEWTAPDGLRAVGDTRPCGADDLDWELGPDEGRFGSGITLTNRSASECHLPVDLTMSFTGRELSAVTDEWTAVDQDVARRHPIANHYVEPVVRPGQPVGIVITAPSLSNWLGPEDMHPVAAQQGEIAHLEFPDGSVLDVVLDPEEYSFVRDWWGPTTPWTGGNTPECSGLDVEASVVADPQIENDQPRVWIELRHAGEAICALPDPLSATTAEDYHRAGVGGGLPVRANPFLVPGSAVYLGLLTDSASASDGELTLHLGTDLPIDLGELDVGAVTGIVGPLPSPDSP